VSAPAAIVRGGLATMDRNELSAHVTAVARRDHDQTAGLAAWMSAACWPGGSADRVERAALDWVARWRPRSAGTRLTPCTCQSGRCRLCN
jgi:hypothetical protein